MSISRNGVAAKIAFFAVIVAFVVIALGAFTRLADAGLGCPDWPTCYGHILWPETAEQINSANSVFTETPVETNKTWPEQVHRLFASSLGFISLLLFGLAVKNNPDRRQNVLMTGVVVMLLTALVSKIALKMTWTYGAEAMHDIYDVVVGFTVLGLFLVIAASAKQHGTTVSALKLSTFLVAFVILQGLFGMWTVTLKVWPQVVTLHLLGGFSVVSTIWILAQRLQGLSWQLPTDSLQQVKALKPLAIAGLVIVFVQIALGGWTASNYAAVACPDLPTCQARWWP
ncbi:MAG: COX15/CtaA family protein, partial [Sinobacterium sp.]|nr:COX15/CtaA family protein [Sinobacterium sp.]